MSSNRREKVFHVKSDGWVSATMGTPMPSNRAALQNAIDKGAAWAAANDFNRAYYAAREFAPCTWATDGYFDDTFMANGPCARSSNTDWVTPAAGDRVLVKNHADDRKNGLYLIPSSGAWTRTTDANLTAHFERAQSNVRVLNGFHWKGTRWRLAGGAGPISSLGTDLLPWWGVPLTAMAIIVSDGEPIYVDGPIDVKPGVLLALTSPIIGKTGITAIEDLVVLRSNTGLREQLRVHGSYLHGGVRVSHQNNDQRLQFAPIEVLNAGARGAGARDQYEGPGSATRPLHAFSAYGYPVSLTDVWTTGGDVGHRVFVSDCAIHSLYALASGDGAWIRVQNGSIKLLNIDTPSGVPLRIDQTQQFAMQAIVATNTATPTDIVKIGDHLPYSWATNQKLDLSIITLGQGTNALNLATMDGPSHIRLVQGATVTNAVKVGASVTNRVHIDADLQDADVPHSFAPGVTTGPTMSYRQAGAQKAVKSGGGTHVTVVGA